MCVKSIKYGKGAMTAALTDGRGALPNPVITSPF